MSRVALPVLTILLASTTARAQEPERVVILAAEAPDAPVVSRVYDELVAMGLRVELAPPSTPAGDVPALRRERGASAAVLVSASSDITIFVSAERESGRIRGGDDPATAALATAEALRGFLVDVPREDRSVPEPGPDESSRTLALHAGPAMMLSPGGIPDQVALTLGAELYVAGRAYLEVVADVGVPGLTVTGKHDEIPVWTATLGAGVGYSLLPANDVVDMSIGGGVAALAVLFEARNATSAAFAALPYLRFVTRLRFTRALAARLDAAAGFALPSPEIEIKGRNPTFGRPLVTLAASVELSW